MLNNTIIYLIGFAGTGKLTIARELVKRTGAVLVDNHLINNPVFSMLRPDGITPLPEAVWTQTWAIRRIVLETIRTLSPRDFSFIFTNELVDGFSDDVKLFAEVEEVAEAREARFLPVRLICDGEELARRVVSEERRQNFKDRDGENARRKVKLYTVFTPAHPATVTLDVTALSADDAAEAIINAVIRR